MLREEAMSSREQCDQLLREIDAVLSECSKDPRRRTPIRPPSRPAWAGPSWLRDQGTGGSRSDDPGPAAA